MPGHYHAVVWIDQARARVLHFSLEVADKSLKEADKTTIHPDHSVRDVSHGEKRTGHRVPVDREFLEKVADALADAGAILIVGPGQEKNDLAKFLAEKHPSIRARVEGVESADHPTDGELLDHARRFVEAADRMRPQA